MLTLLHIFCIAVAFIGGALFLLQQFAGINGVLYFSSLTFHDVGITSSALASLFVGVTNFAGLKSITPSILLLEMHWKSINFDFKGNFEL